jgi:hypothetical protein
MMQKEWCLSSGYTLNPLRSPGLREATSRYVRYCTYSKNKRQYCPGQRRLGICMVAPKCPNADSPCLTAEDAEKMEDGFETGKNCRPTPGASVRVMRVGLRIIAWWPGDVEAQAALTVVIISSHCGAPTVSSVVPLHSPAWAIYDDVTNAIKLGHQT